MSAQKKRGAKSGSRKSGPPRHVKNRRHASRGLPDVMTLVITEISEHGDLVAIPEAWPAHKKPPFILVRESRHAPAAGLKDRVLAKIAKAGTHRYHAQVIRILPKEVPKTIIGIFVPHANGGGRIEPVSRKIKEPFTVAKDHVNGATAGDLVKAELLYGLHERLAPEARIEACLGDARAPRAASLIAAHLHSLPSEFSSAVLDEAHAAPLPVLSAGREDMRHLALVTIDGEDARDFDDAVFAEPDPQDAGGFHLIVAIADVAFYVREHSALDAEAFLRGNSVYFPDRVIPMLPERLSNGLCSLKPDEDRYCLAVHLWVDAQGVTKRYRFARGLMRSKARLTYTQAEQPATLVDVQVQALVKNLFAAYGVLANEIEKRGALAINLPEYKVSFDAHGEVAAIVKRETLKSHRLIEAFMVAANVAAADFLIEQRSPGIYRVHESPSQDKLDDLRRFLGLSGYSIPKGTITPAHLNRVLHKAQTAPNAAMIHTSVLRSQMQAYYDSKNFGHFGLGLTHYCHFTSPIRRYSDLIVHRSLSALLEGNKYKPAHNLKDVSTHISQTERTAMMAERDAMDRYKIGYLARQKEKLFFGTITSLNEYGLFVGLKDNGITGFVPVHQLGEDFFVYQAKLASFKGRQSHQTYKLGDALNVRVIEADALKGSLIFRPEHKNSKKLHSE